MRYLFRIVGRFLTFTFHKVVSICSIHSTDIESLLSLTVQLSAMKTSSQKALLQRRNTNCHSNLSPIHAPFGLTSNPLRLNILSTGVEEAEGENIFAYQPWAHCHRAHLPVQFLSKVDGTREIHFGSMV